jgi:hypothetical protein
VTCPAFILCLGRNMISKKFVFGLGSGRCGTVTLAHVLNSQKRSCVTHEGVLPLPWGLVEPMMFHITMVNVTHYPGVTNGDVALYYLNYIREILYMIPPAKFVCLKRNKEATVTSYLNHIKEYPSTFITNKMPSKSSSFLWHHARPKYEVETEEEGIRLYYDEYYKRAELWESVYPEVFRIFKSETVLNQEEEQEEMLRWIGIEEPIIVTDVCLNKTGGERY